MKTTSSALPSAVFPLKPPAFQGPCQCRWVNGDKARFVSLFIQATEPDHHRAIHRRPVQGQDNRRRFLRIVTFRDVDNVAAFLLAYHQGAGVVAGAERIRLLSGRILSEGLPA